MCNRFTQLTPAEQLAARFDLNEHGPNLPPAYNIAPTDPAQFIFEEGGKRRIDVGLFGLIPHWAKDAKIATHCLNARSETVNKVSAFRGAFKKQRCLIPTEGFFDWKTLGKEKIPHRFIVKGSDVFGLAGLWDEWQAPNGKKVKTFTILTTSANSFMAPFKDRMPVILPKENESLWLAPYVTEEKTLLPLLKPFPSELMDCYRVTKAMNKPAYKEADTVIPVKEA